MGPLAIEYSNHLPIIEFRAQSGTKGRWQRKVLNYCLVYKILFKHSEMQVSLVTKQLLRSQTLKTETCVCFFKTLNFDIEAKNIKFIKNDTDNLSALTLQIHV